MAVAGLGIIGKAIAFWPATLQALPEGLFDAAFGRLFAGIRIVNGSAQAWPATEVRVSPRGAQLLNTAHITVVNGWSGNDAAAVGQSTASAWISLPALAAGASYMIFIKLDLSKATTGLHSFELELRDPTAPATTLKTSTQLPVARTSCHGPQRTFTSVCDEGVLTASLSALSIDQGSLRRALKKARALAALGATMRTPAENELLRQRFRALLCGEEGDLCKLLADLNAECALPSGSLPTATPLPSSVPVMLLSDQATNVGARAQVLEANLFSNHGVSIGNDAIVNGDITSGGNVSIGDRTQVRGDVNAAGLITTSPSGAAVVTGERNERVTVAAQVIPTKTVVPGTTNITVNSNTGTAASPYVLAPGKYGNITINSSNVVSLSPGVYEVTQLLINADVTLKLNLTSSAVDFRVKTALSFGDRLVVQPGNPASGVTAQFYSAQTTEVAVGTDIASFPIALTVPGGTVHVFSRTKLTAPLAAKTITLEPDVTVGAGSATGVVGSDWLGTGDSGVELLAYPTTVDYSVAYTGGYFGGTGPLAFGAVSWKALLASALLQFDLALPAAVAAALVAIADAAVVGNLQNSVLNAPTTAPGTPPLSTQAGSVDAAVASVRGNRSLGAPLFAQLDAATGEANAAPISDLDGVFNTNGFLTNAEIDAALASGSTANLKVHKSGAGTGVTRGLISALVPVIARDDESGTLQFINQLVIIPDPAAPPNGGKAASFGDSGSVWVQTSSSKVVALTHTVGATGVVASRIQDVVNALQIQLS